MRPCRMRRCNGLPARGSMSVAEVMRDCGYKNAGADSTARVSRVSKHRKEGLMNEPALWRVCSVLTYV
jgi:hypothetical protein